MNGHEALEEFLEAAVQAGTTTFKVTDAVNWMNASGTYPYTVNKHDVSKMIQRYSWTQRRRDPDSEHRSDAFVPKYVVDCNKRGGPNAFWTIHRLGALAADDAKVAIDRTADDIAATALNRFAERVLPSLAQNPTALAAFEPFQDAMAANLKAFAALAKGYKP